MCEIAIGTDTGGSCRIPGALYGVVGYKPSRAAYSYRRCFSVVMQHSTRSGRSPARSRRARADAVMAAENFEPLNAVLSRGASFRHPARRSLEKLDETVAKRFSDQSRGYGKPVHRSLKRSFRCSAIWRR